MEKNIILDCGWGNLLFSKTFESENILKKNLKKERKGGRNIAFDVDHPHILIAENRNDFFINPGYVFRLNLKKFFSPQKKEGFFIRLAKEEDIKRINAIYQQQKMISLPLKWLDKKPDNIIVLVAEDNKTGKVIGVSMGVDHHTFLENKTASIWALATDPQSKHLGIGMSLMKETISFFQKKERKYLLLSVVHSNTAAIKLYEKIGFKKVPIFNVKNKSIINESLFISRDFDKSLTPEEKQIIYEARKRGIYIEKNKITPEYFRLVYGGRSVHCCETLSEMTNSIVQKRCEDKKLLRSLLQDSGISVPEGVFCNSVKKSIPFLSEKKQLMLRPRMGEWTSGVLKTERDIKNAYEQIKALSPEFLIREFIEGDKYYILVINSQVIAVSKAKPPSIIGNGKHNIKTLISKLSRRKIAATDGQSKIPLDSRTRSTIAQQGYSFDDVLPLGEKLIARKTSNFHTGGTFYDKTENFPHFFKQIAIKASRVLELNIGEFEIIIPDKEKNEYYIVNASAKPHFSYYSSQAVEKKFLDYLFPRSKKI